LDPYGTKFSNLNFIALNILDGIRFPTALFIFVVVLFHWVDIYLETINRLNQQEMLSKIKKDYKGDVTIDEILSTVRNIHRFRFPCGVAVTLMFLFRIAGSITKGLLMPVYIPLQIIFGVFMFVAFALVTCGYIYFGYKLYMLFPRPIDKKTKKLPSVSYLWHLILPVSFSLLPFGTMLQNMMKIPS